MPVQQFIYGNGCKPFFSDDTGEKRWCLAPHGDNIL